MSVAKVASRRAKPDGVVVVPPSEVTSFLHPLDVGELYGVGEKTQALLHRFGLRTVGDVAHTPLQTLQRALGDHLGRHLHHLAWGTDRRDLSPTAGPHEPERSMRYREQLNANGSPAMLVSAGYRWEPGTELAAGRLPTDVVPNGPHSAHQSAHRGDHA